MSDVERLCQLLAAILARVLAKQEEAKKKAA
jgi:hypothetical protein